MLPIEHRALCIAAAANAIADKIHTGNICAASRTQLLALADAIRGHAAALRADSAPPVPEPRPAYEGNVVPLRRRH